MNFCNFDRSCGKTLTRFDSSSWKKSATASSSVTTNLLIYSLESYCFRKLSFEYVSNSRRRFLSFFQSFYAIKCASGFTTECTTRCTGCSTRNVPEVPLKSNIPHIGVQYYIFCLVKLYQFCSGKSFELLHKVLSRRTLKEFKIFFNCPLKVLYMYDFRSNCSRLKP